MLIRDVEIAGTVLFLATAGVAGVGANTGEDLELQVKYISIAKASTQ
jgi:hypothetical protein